MRKVPNRKKTYIAKEWETKILNAISKTRSMTEAYKLLGLERKTFKRMAEELGVYKPNQSGKGKPKNNPKYSMEDIFNGKHPEYQSHKLKKRLIEEGYKEHKCEKCDNKEWLGFPIPLELHHKNGDKHDHSFDNLELLCPNCHALTETYRSKNLPSYQKKVKESV